MTDFERTLSEAPKENKWVIRGRIALSSINRVFQDTIRDPYFWQFVILSFLDGLSRGDSRSNSRSDDDGA